MRITLAQVDSRLGDVDANVERAEQVLVGEARLGLLRREIDRLLDEGGDL